jgi:hypothetical protein
MTGSFVPVSPIAHRTRGEGARARKSCELCWVGGIGVPSTIWGWGGWLIDSLNNFLAVGVFCSLSGYVGWVLDLSLAGDRPASPSLLFEADLSAGEGRTARSLNVWITPLDLEYFN